MLHDPIHLIIAFKEISMKMTDWEVYIIQAKSGHLYTGITNNIERRMEAHQTKKGGARFFHFSAPEVIVFRETHKNRSDATIRECLIKKMSRKQKLALISLHKEL